MAEAAGLVGLVEDDPDQAALYGFWLEQAGFTVRHYEDAGDFRRRLGVESVDLLLLDWNLPDESGLDILTWLRRDGHTRLPVIFLTARNDEADVVAGLRAGADDYLSKPPRQGELLARVDAMLRRVGLGQDAASVEELPPYVIDYSRRRISMNGRDISLTEREFDLAAFLFRRRGRVVSREALLEGVWNIRSDVATRTVETHISRLRKKLELAGEHGWRLNAVYQHGYRLEAG